MAPLLAKVFTFLPRVAPPPARICVHTVADVAHQPRTHLAPTNTACRLLPATSRERASAKSVSSRRLCVTWVADCLMPEPNPGEKSCLSSITDCDKTTGPAPLGGKSVASTRCHRRTGLVV